MRSFFIPVACLFFVAACTTNSGESSIVLQPPYKALTDSIDNNPQSAELYYRRGSLLYQNKQLSYAEEDLKKAWKLNPKEEFALGLVTILKEKSADSAIAFLGNALKKMPHNIALKIALARGLQQKNEIEKALLLCNEISSQYPNQLDVLLLKSELLKDQNKNAEALTTLETAYSFAPGDVELAHTLAFEYAEAKNQKAISLSDSLIKTDFAKRQAGPYYFKGIYYYNTGNLREALKQLDAAIQTDYTFINAYINKGIIYYDEKKYDQAIKTFKLASAVSPTSADPYYWLGKTEEAKGNKAEAKLNYQRAYGLDKSLKKAKEAAERLN